MPVSGLKPVVIVPGAPGRIERQKVRCIRPAGDYVEIGAVVGSRDLAADGIDGVDGSEVMASRFFPRTVSPPSRKTHIYR
jgi:hypothetical protein